MVDLDIVRVLDDMIGEGTDPATSNHSAAFVVSKSNLRGRGGDKGFGAAILAVSISVIPAVTEC